MMVLVAPTKRSLGETLRRERQSARMTQDQLALATGITQSQISRIEKGENVPSLDEVAALERALRIERGYLLISGGFLDVGSSVPWAIAHDPDLNRSARNALLALYRIYVDEAREAGRS